MNRIYVLMGKSASGKDAIYRNLLADETLGLRKVVGYTTRPMRKGEEEGKQYRFVGEETYRAFQAQKKLIEDRAYDTKLGVWRYFTADDGQIDLEQASSLLIATPAAFPHIRAYFGEERVKSILIDSDDGLRLERALRRERRQEAPRYDEMCRRFLADAEDFAADKLQAAGICNRFPNDGTLEECLTAVRQYIVNGT